MSENYQVEEKIGEVKVGDLYKYLILPNGRKVEAGVDIIGWDDPDLEHRPDDHKYVTMRVFTGYIDKIYERPDGSIQVTIEAGVGRLPVEDVDFDPDRADRFLSSDAEKSICEEWFALDPEAPADMKLEEEYRLTEY